MEYNREMPQVVPHAEAATTLKNLGRRLSNVTGFEECIAALQKGEAASIEGVPRSARFWSVSFRGFVPLKNFGDAIRVYKNEAHLAPPLWLTLVSSRNMIIAEMRTPIVAEF